MTGAILALIIGLIVLVWSADKFVDGASAVAKHFGMSPLLIGMVIVGFGTSAPEMVVSATASMQGNPGLALGNAYGSNITNIALILGLTAILSPIVVNSQVVRKELPILSAVSFLALFQLWDGELSRTDAIVLLLVFLGLVGWSIWQGLTQNSDALAKEIEAAESGADMVISKAWLWLIAGLVMLILSSRLFVWGAVEVALLFGVSDLIIGLTIVAVGTSLPELASSIIAARKGAHDLALGNVLGSNLFNTLAVVGIAGMIAPVEVSPELISRDLTVMIGLTLSLFVIGYGFKGKGRVNRYEGGFLLLAYVAYTAYLLSTA